MESVGRSEIHYEPYGQRRFLRIREECRVAAGNVAQLRLPLYGEHLRPLRQSHRQIRQAVGSRGAARRVHRRKQPRRYCQSELLRPVPQRLPYIFNRRCRSQHLDIRLFALYQPSFVLGVEPYALADERLFLPVR